MPPRRKPNLNLNSSFIFDAIIVGAGPAGLSAALAMSRIKHPAVVFNSSEFRNARAHRAHTMLSRDHRPASEIRKIVREQIEEYGTTHFVGRTVNKARRDEEANVFEVMDETGEKWRGKKIILAMGAKDISPKDIEGYAECWGESVLPCLVCDGIERSDRPAGMLGFDSPRNLHNIFFIFQFGCTDVTIFSDGPLGPKDDATLEALEIAKSKGAKVDQRRIKKLVHLNDAQGIEIVFEDGESTRIGFLQHTPPTEIVAPNPARDLGVEILPDGRGGTVLKRNEPFGETNVKGVFTAGDTAVIMKQFTLAMAHGAAAGVGAALQLGQEEAQEIAKKLKERS